MSAYTGEPEQSDEVACSCCSRRIAQGRVARMEHEDCEPQGIDAARVREARAYLYESTALMLRDLGRHERAAVHQAEAERIRGGRL